MVCQALSWGLWLEEASASRDHPAAALSLEDRLMWHSLHLMKIITYKNKKLTFDGRLPP